MGEKARETVRSKFLMTRLLEQYLDLFDSFETVVRVRDNPVLVACPGPAAHATAGGGSPRSRRASRPVAHPPAAAGTSGGGSE